MDLEIFDLHIFLILILFPAKDMLMFMIFAHLLFYL